MDIQIRHSIVKMAQYRLNTTKDYDRINLLLLLLFIEQQNA